MHLINPTLDADVIWMSVACLLRQTILASCFWSRLSRISGQRNSYLQSAIKPSKCSWYIPDAVDEEECPIKTHIGYCKQPSRCSHWLSKCQRTIIIDVGISMKSRYSGVTYYCLYTLLSHNPDKPFPEKNVMFGCLVRFLEVILAKNFSPSFYILYVSETTCIH